MSCRENHRCREDHRNRENNRGRERNNRDVENINIFVDCGNRNNEVRGSYDDERDHGKHHCRGNQGNFGFGRCCRRRCWF